MTISLLTAKAFLAPAAGAVVVGAGVGGTYYVYTNRSTTNNTNNQTTAQIKTNAFIARVETAGSGSTTITAPLKCVLGTDNEVNCKVFTFNTAKTNNVITKFEKTTQTSQITTNSDLKAKNYVLVELEGNPQTFETLKNKSISLKSGTTEITKLNFDQLLVASKPIEANKTSYEPLTAEVDTYIISTPSTEPTTESDTTVSGFRCKYKKDGQTSHIENFDDSCKLITITQPTSDKTITSLQEFKSSVTPTATLTTSTFYKLTLNPKLLYNLDFENATDALTVEVAITNGTKSSNVTLHQKLKDDAFVGKTNLVLAKVTSAKAEANATVTGNKCNFSKATSNQFECNLHKAADAVTNPEDMHKLTITTSATTTSDSYDVGKYFVIKLTAAQDISTLTKGKKIYYQMTKTGSSDKHDLVELEIAQLLSGEFSSSKKPLYITNHASQVAA